MKKLIALLSSLAVAAPVYSQSVTLDSEWDTSAEIATNVTDETGSGALVFGTSPTLTTPALGTPSALVLTNATGLPESLVFQTMDLTGDLDIINTTPTDEADTGISLRELLNGYDTNFGNLLFLDNVNVFTPTLDYHPATKKYVDDQTGLGTADIDTQSEVNAILTDLLATAQTASATQTQGGGTAITAKFSFFTIVATDGNAATLPAAPTAGNSYYVINDDSAEYMQVFPPVGDTINSESINAAVQVNFGQSGTFIYKGSDLWLFTTSEIAETDLPTNNRTQVLSVLLFDDATDSATGNGAGDIFWRVPSTFNGYDLVGVAGAVQTAGTTGTTDVQVHNVTQAADMLTTVLTIDSAETDSSTAATPAVIDTANDDVATGDQIRFDVDAVSTTPSKGLMVELQFRLP